MIHERFQNQLLERASRALAGTVQAGLLAAGFALGASVAQAQAAPAGGDGQLQSAVQSALAADAQLRGQQIAATAQQGVITLSGNVADDTQRIAAEQTAAQVSGVRSINDSIVVGTQSASADGNETTGIAQPVNGGSVPTDQNATAPNQQDMPPAPPADTTPQQAGGQYPQYPQQSGQYPPQQSGQYPQQPGQYAPQPGQYPPQYGQNVPRRYAPGVAPEKQNTSGPVTLAPGLLLNVRTSEMLSTARLKAGDFVQFTAAGDLYADGVVAVPRGAVITGQVTEAKNAGAFGGSPKLDLKLTTLTMGGQTYPLVSDVWSSQGPSKTGYTAANTVGGAAFGALIGAIAGGGIGAGVGAVAGGASGALISGATHGPRLDLPPEALLQFHLTAPLTVQPVKYDEAQRLAASAPVLHTRPAYAVAPYRYYPRPYPYYGYPPPPPYYVRPY